MTACIPASELNQKAMEEFRSRIVALRKILQDLVKPVAIVGTLADLSDIALLRGPDRSGP